MTLRFLRKPDITERLCRGNHAIWKDVKAGLLPPPVAIGPRAVGWVEHEIDAIARGRILGMADDEIRNLVRRLVAERQKLAEGLR